MHCVYHITSLSCTCHHCNPPIFRFKLFSNSRQKYYILYLILDARSTCLERGGDLLSVTTEEENKAIAEKIKYGTDDYFWISLNDRDYRGIYYWSNDEAYGLTNWGSGAPESSRDLTSMKFILFIT